MTEADGFKIGKYRDLRMGPSFRQDKERSLRKDEKELLSLSIRQVKI